MQRNLLSLFVTSVEPNWTNSFLYMYHCPMDIWFTEQTTLSKLVLFIKP